jgi:hypothetical protein
MFRGTLDKDPCNIVDRGAVDERLDQFRSCAQESQQDDNETLPAVGRCEVEENAPDTAACGNVH